ncbi:MAG: hypothetical protein NTW21_24665 [Verrucomicrobia bacterium]|nr:hypothetical protein [Verrucomicrobiota bacterium]
MRGRLEQAEGVEVVETHGCEYFAKWAKQARRRSPPTNLTAG